LEDKWNRLQEEQVRLQDEHDISEDELDCLHGELIGFRTSRKGSTGFRTRRIVRMTIRIGCRTII